MSPKFRFGLRIHKVCMVNSPDEVKEYSVKVVVVVEAEVVEYSV